MTNVAVQLNPIGNMLGLISVGLGIISAFLMILSQYIDASLNNPSIVWTPVLVTIAIIQVACTLGLYTSTKMAQKRAGKPRYTIRY
jgi:hypothetical protein